MMMLTLIISTLVLSNNLVMKINSNRLKKEQPVFLQTFIVELLMKICANQD